MSDAEEGLPQTEPPTQPVPGLVPAIGSSADALLANANPVPKTPYRDRKREHKLQRQIDEHGLRKAVARYTYIATAAQIIVADVVFLVYAWVGVHWHVPTGAITAWLSATVVQVIAVLLVITRYLFPENKRRP